MAMAVVGNKPEYTLEEIRQIRQEAQLFGLDAPQSFWLAPDTELQRVYNGCGPDRWPGWLRWLASKFTHHLRAAVAIHDWEYELSDKSRTGFDAANSRFLHNMRAVIDYIYSWWSDAKDKAFAYVASQLMYLAVQYGGWSAWCDKMPSSEGEKC